MQLKFNDLHYSLFPLVELPHHWCFFLFLSTATGGAGTAKSVYWSRCRLDSAGFKSQKGQEIFLCSIMSRLALGSMQPPGQWVVILPWGYRGWDTHLHPGLGLRKSGATPLFPLPHMPSWCWQGQLTLYPAISSLSCVHLFPTPFCFPYFISTYSKYFISQKC